MTLYPAVRYEEAIALLESYRAKYDHYLGIVDARQEMLSRGDHQRAAGFDEELNQALVKLHESMAELGPVQRYMNTATLDASRRTRLRVLVAEVAARAATARGSTARLNHAKQRGPDFAA